MVSQISQKKLANKAFKKALTDVDFYGKVVNMTGDLVMAFLGLAEHGFYFDMKLDFGQEDVPDGVIIENGVLVRWPNEAIPENGHVTIPNSVTCIGDEAFTFCHSLTSITIPNSVTSIREKAFSGCICLRSIIIPNSVTSIGERAFEGCIRLKSIIIPNSVTSIENETFWNCTSLKSVTIPNSVTSIGNSAFEKCNSLTSIIIPNSVTSIGEGAFVDCNSLTSIVCKALVPPIFSGDHSGNDQHRIDLGYYKKLIVPIGTKHLYEQAEGWKKCSPIVEEDL